MANESVNPTRQLFENMNSGEAESYGPEAPITTEEASAFLKVSPYYLRNLCSNGYVPYHKFGQRNRYLKSDLVKLLNATRKGGFRGV